MFLFSHEENLRMDLPVVLKILGLKTMLSIFIHDQKTGSIFYLAIPKSKKKEEDVYLFIKDLKLENFIKFTKLSYAFKVAWLGLHTIAR